mmetsp:Transcript_118478/g.185952  ORF Transcript_118478/g.185952 Transcript_118478/m.185952 type:complete len:266 (-) Transcript_118478:61-858(-)
MSCDSAFPLTCLDKPALSVDESTSAVSDATLDPDALSQELTLQKVSVDEAEVEPAWLTIPFDERPGVQTYADWDRKAVSAFISASCDLPQYEGTVKANNITGSHLRELRHHGILNVGLQRAGICSLEHQRRISEEMLRVECGSPASQRHRLNQTMQTWDERQRALQMETKPKKPAPLQSCWDSKRKELSFGRLTTCYMPFTTQNRYQYGPRLDLTRTAKLMRREATVPAQFFSSETRKTMQPYDSHRHAKKAGLAACSRGLVKVM